MAMGWVQLIPGVDTQKTPSVNEAGVFQSQLIRYKENLIQTMGGWTQFGPITIASTIREFHAWEGFNGDKFLGIGATGNGLAQSLLTIDSDGVNSDITPQILKSDVAPNFSISSGSNIVTIVDANSSTQTVNNVVFFNTPIAIGNLLLNGAYPINTFLAPGSYTILSSVVSSTTIASSGQLPIFGLTANSPTVDVGLPNHNLTPSAFNFFSFYAPTQIGSPSSQHIQGPYKVAAVVNSSVFRIQLTQQSTQTASITMNGGNAEFLYYITLGAVAAGSAYGAGAYSSGAYGIGTPPAGITGTQITATDWSLDNWGEILLACPKDGPIYTWSEDSGFQNAQVVATAPFFNGGIFVSQPQQILVSWRSVQNTGTQDPLIVRWSDALDYTNWVVSNQTTAGSFHIPTGSIIRGGIQGPNFGMIWTDVDAWVMSYVGGDIIFNFTRVGTGCGLLGQHARAILSGTIYWVSQNNFFMNGPSGVVPIPCTVWDAIFQNINPAYQDKTVLGANSAFNELICFYPSAASTGENDSYVKVHIEGQEFEWDYGTLMRTAWLDLSILGNPLGGDTGGVIWQHESGNTWSGATAPFFRTGWFNIADGNELVVVDWILPDFIWGDFSTAKDAQVQLTFFVADYPGDTPRTYGPYTVTQAKQYLNVRFRGRLMSVFVQSATQEFSRLGRIRFRFATSGRR